MRFRHWNWDRTVDFGNNWVEGTSCKEANGKQSYSTTQLLEFACSFFLLKYVDMGKVLYLIGDSQSSAPLGKFRRP